MGDIGLKSEIVLTPGYEILINCVRRDIVDDSILYSNFIGYVHFLTQHRYAYSNIRSLYTGLDSDFVVFLSLLGISAYEEGFILNVIELSI